MFRNVFWHPKGTNNLWDKMEDYLRVKSVDLPVDDILPMDEYRKAAEWALGATSAMTAEAQAASLPSTKLITAIPTVLPKTDPELEKKIERLASENEKLQGMFSTVLSLFQAQQQHQMYPPQQFQQPPRFIPPPAQYGPPPAQYLPPPGINQQYQPPVAYSGYQNAPGPPRRTGGQQQGQQSGPTGTLCRFDGATTGCQELIRNCPGARRYVEQGLMKRREGGGHLFPNGDYIAKELPGRDIKEQVDLWHAQNKSSAFEPQATTPVTDSNQRHPEASITAVVAYHNVVVEEEDVIPERGMELDVCNELLNVLINNPTPAGYEYSDEEVDVLIAEADRARELRNARRNEQQAAAERNSRRAAAQASRTKFEAGKKQPQPAPAPASPLRNASPEPRIPAPQIPKAGPHEPHKAAPLQVTEDELPDLIDLATAPEPPKPPKFKRRSLSEPFTQFHRCSGTE
ncbi:hypothetical protein CALCODRAFT_488676 [Calocera cornea HHB12733]|uniref:Uncharacterized protein n=1 Tax=Calocera cornea HHB12733 TaxID=1353952 RepID=A0A165CA29_9BASI|nr:hypothetical protein CALCODRAFT_488676 [Calocera cornea HHB12733]